MNKTVNLRISGPWWVAEIEVRGRARLRRGTGARGHKVDRRINE